MWGHFQDQCIRQNKKCLECNLDLDSDCPKCDEPNKSTEECIYAQGVCDCVFHFHCISTYLKNNVICPIHKTEWWYKRYWERKQLFEDCPFVF